MERKREREKEGKREKQLRRHRRTPADAKFQPRLNTMQLVGSSLPATIVCLALNADRSHSITPTSPLRTTILAPGAT
jgi:hypothetical protein